MVVSSWYLLFRHLSRSQAEIPLIFAVQISRTTSASKITINRNGTVAGGVIAQMIDSAGIQVVRTLAGKNDRIVTLELKVNYVRPASAEGGLTTTANAEHVGNTTGLSVARVHNLDGKLVAYGTVTSNIRRFSE